MELDETYTEGCYAEGPKGWTCTHHKDGMHHAFVDPNGELLESWPIEEPIRGFTQIVRFSANTKIVAVKVYRWLRGCGVRGAKAVIDSEGYLGDISVPCDSKSKEAITAYMESQLMKGFLSSWHLEERPLVLESPSDGMSYSSNGLAAERWLDPSYRLSPSGQSKKWGESLAMSWRGFS